MPDDRDLAALARAIIDANLYMVLGTADSSGTTWVSPVYYASAGYREFFWILGTGRETLAEHRRQA